MTYQAEQLADELRGVAKQTIEAGQAFAPMGGLFLDGEHQAMVLTNGGSMEHVYSVFGLTSIVAGSDECVIAADSWFRKRRISEGPLPEVIPSDDPEAGEAVMSAQMDGWGNTTATYEPYGRDDDGSITWEEPDGYTQHINIEVLERFVTEAKRGDKLPGGLGVNMMVPMLACNVMRTAHRLPIKSELGIVAKELAFAAVTVCEDAHVLWAPHLEPVLKQFLPDDIGHIMSVGELMSRGDPEMN